VHHLSLFVSNFYAPFIVKNDAIVTRDVDSGCHHVVHRVVHLAETTPKDGGTFQDGRFFDEIRHRRA